MRKAIDGLCDIVVKKGDMLAEPRRRLLLDRIARQGFATLDELVKSLGVSESTVRRDLEALDLAGVVKRTHGGAVFAAAEARAMPAFDERTASATAGEAGHRPGGRRPDRRRRHGPARRRDDHPGSRPGPARPAGPGRDQQPADRPARGLQQGDRPDPDRRLRLPPDRRGAGPAGDRDDAGHPGPQGDPGGRGDRGRGGLQLEPAPGRDRAADDGLRAGRDDRRRPHQVRPALAGLPLRARRDRRPGGRPRPRRVRPGDARSRRGEGPPRPPARRDRTDRRAVNGSRTEA